MSDERPTREQVFTGVTTEGKTLDAAAGRGRLKLFFGYAAGVGKTHAMLQAAQTARAEGEDVVAACVDAHGRPETEALIEGLECLPALQIPYRGGTLREFDLDAALARRPGLIVVDELAHGNAPGMRHAKRWQDVEELLAAGINVYSTANVQDLESLSEIIAQITGATAGETFPDDVFERAHRVALIDVHPDELLERLRQGKVHIPEQSAHASDQLFRRDNLLVLRDIAIRQAADRVRTHVETARRAGAGRIPRLSNERLLACVSPSPTSAKVVQAAKRLAGRMDAEWIALHVEAPQAARMSDEDRQGLHEHLRLAEDLGAEVVQVSGDDVATELIEYAASRNVTTIVVGKTKRRRQRRLLRPSLADCLVRDAGDIDVLVVRGVDEPIVAQAASPGARRRPGAWVGTTVALCAATLVAAAFNTVGFGRFNLVMIYLLAVIVVAVRYGVFPSVAASAGSVLLFAVLFTPRSYWVGVRGTQHLLAFAVMLGVGLFASVLTARVRRQADVARRNEHRMEGLFRLSRRLIAISDRRQLVEEVERAISEVFGVDAAVFVPDEDGRIRSILRRPETFGGGAWELAAAQWVFDHNQAAGAGTNHLSSARALYLPMATPNAVAGVLAVWAEGGRMPVSPGARRFLDTYATQVALAMEREQLARQEQQAQLQIESEKMRSSLLSAVSHDLRTPLAAIAGAGSSLSEAFDSLDADTRADLLHTICDESDRLSRLVENVLHMTRLSGGRIAVNRQWQPVDEVIGSALNRMSPQLRGRPVQVQVPDDPPLGRFDDVLVEQLLMNLLDNAVKYSEEGSPITIRVESLASRIAIEVSDRGRGLREGDERRVFEMFYRGADAKSDRRGAGLGLAICKAIVAAHGGTIEAANRPGGGAAVRFTLPHNGSPPTVDLEESGPSHS